MSLGLLAPFEEDELTLVLMGPGLGESVLVRWPPSYWLVVDSFRRTNQGVEHHPVLDVLTQFEAEPSAVALTHPHEDHTAGFASLISRCRAGAPVGWLAAPQTDAWWATPNAVRATKQGATEHAIAAIERVWDDDPDSRWELHAGVADLQLGETTISVLSPPQAVVDEVLATKRPDLNRISSAMLVTWRGCRLLLGADLTHSGWETLQADYGTLHFADTAGIKIAHHGSEEAQHSVALGQPPARERLSVATPYSRGKKVPDFADDQDVDLLLRLTTRVYLTTHHGPLPPGSSAGDVVRTAVPVPARLIGRHRVALDSVSPPLQDCWVAAQFAPDGGLLRVRRGAASMSVVNG